MLLEISGVRLLKLSLLTSILFGMLGAVPFINNAVLQYSLIWNGFLVLFLLVLVQWGVNIALLISFRRHRTAWILAYRFLLSTIICMILFYAGFELLISGMMPQMALPPVKQLPPDMPDMKRPPEGIRYIFPMIQSLSINACILVILELLLLDSRKQKIEKENNTLRIASLEARHSQLQQQLHPHFIFNALNILKSLIRKKPDQAEEYLIQLSEILRFSIYTNKKTVIPLENELELVKHYLSMQQLRFGEALQTEIILPPEMPGGYVPVYSIQLLIENAIKHNRLLPEQPLSVRIFGNAASNTITVQNNLQTRLTVETGSGVGLSNLSERYQLLGNLPVMIHRDKEKFNVTIKVLQDENSNH
ncbi:MAG: histidine kinase [Bacteroidetes bacterium]|nr:histidine kinase [Bacteroidota bacterium]